MKKHLAIWKPMMARFVISGEAFMSLHRGNARIGINLSNCLRVCVVVQISS